MKLIIDLETNGFLDMLDVIHCIVFKDIETQKVYSYNPDNLSNALELLKKATLLIGHNIQGFDLPALDKVFRFKYKGEILDTLLSSRLIWTNRQELDFKEEPRFFTQISKKVLLFNKVLTIEVAVAVPQIKAVKTAYALLKHLFK